MRARVAHARTLRVRVAMFKVSWTVSTCAARNTLLAKDTPMIVCSVTAALGKEAKKARDVSSPIECNGSARGQEKSSVIACV